MMVSGTVALLINREINEIGFDEENIMGKKIPFLLAEPPTHVDRSSMDDLMPHMSQATYLLMQMPVDKLLETLEDNRDCNIFLVLKQVTKGYQVCIGFTPRDRLVVEAEIVESSPRSPQPPSSSSPSLCFAAPSASSLWQRRRPRPSFPSGGSWTCPRTRSRRGRPLAVHTRHSRRSGSRRRASSANWAAIAA